ncbi:uracil phosphoribosyltransferase [Clostridium beijerinckii]|uniref:uracil phosphoribosyltransferase n=1 Tax=Clostridium beijerinckii TaxID=1520 RepID=UPI0022E60D9B|nr:uracil phosphoribosyltransferase [Clostridium beijerinckii]
MGISLINGKEPFKSLITKFRDKSCNGKELKKTYANLGGIFAIELASYFDFVECDVVTPLNQAYIGSKCVGSNNLLFVSTFEDNESFTKTIGDYYGIKEYAKLNVDRAENGWEASVISFEFPQNIGEIKTVIFCKSVLATGCTAKAILKKICEICNPDNIIVVGILSSNEAIEELKREYRYLNINFLIGEIDKLENETGLLIPGVGMIEDRLKIVDNL